MAGSPGSGSLEGRLLLGQRLNLVAREGELARLTGFLDRALAGNGTVCLVRGEAGAGKSSLATEFADRAMQRHPDLVVASGVCDAQTGVGDAFLPFREILETLTGDVDAKLAKGRISQGSAGRLRRVAGFATEAVIEVGPDLIGAVIPGVSLLAEAGLFLAGRSPLADKLKRRIEGTADVRPADVTQDQIFEQYLRVLERLSEKAPLLLVVDDLQWADTASIGLLFRLGRRVGNNRILVVGLYRPSDVALGRDRERHPLEPVVNELKRYHGDLELDLEPAVTGRGQEFIDAFLDQEPNTLGADFRDSLYEHTGGHPLFTVELLRSLQESGHLHRDATGSWVVDPGLDLSTMPSRVEGVIEERLGRLTEDLRRAMTIAAVEGQDFTAEVVSRVQPEEVRAVVMELSETLQKQHRLVHAVGLERLGRTRLSRYRFAHVMMQDYLLRHLDEVEAAFLHEDVARAIEDLYADALDSVVVRLAHHYEAAGVAEDALRYLTLAGDRAHHAFAPREAAAYYRRALEWATTEEERIPLLLSLVEEYLVSGDTDERRKAIEELEALAASGDRPHERADAMLRRARYELDCGHYPAAREAAQSATAQFAELGDVEEEASALAALSSVGFHSANYPEALEAARRAEELAGQAGRGDVVARAITTQGIVADLTGDRATASERFERALTLHRQAGRLGMVAASLSNLGVMHWRAHGHAEAAAAFAESAELARQVGDVSMEAVAKSNLGMTQRSQGDVGAARRQLEEALVLHREVSNPYGVSRTLGLLGATLLDLGEYGRAREAQTEALELDREVGDRQDEGFRLDALGLLEVQLGRFAEAAEHWSQALAIAAELGDKDLEVTSERGLGEVELQLGRPDAALPRLHRAREVAEELSDQGAVALAELLLGHAHLERGDLDAAGEAYAAALAQDDAPVTPMARGGAAEVAHLSGDDAAALQVLEPVLPDLLELRTAGFVDAFRLHLVAGRILTAAGDDRGAVVLAGGRAELLRRAEGLDPEQRASFLEAVAVNRDLLQTADPPRP